MRTVASWADGSSSTSCIELSRRTSHVAAEHYQPSAKRHWRETKPSPMPSAIRSPSSAADLRSDRFADDERRQSLLRQDLPQQPGITDVTREVRPPRRSTAPANFGRAWASTPQAVSARATSAGSPSSRAIAKIRSTSSIDLVPAEERQQQRLVRGRPYACRRHVAGLVALVGQRGAEPGQPLLDASPRQPQRLQRRRQRQRQLGVRSFSRLHAKAARRLSISVPPARCAARGRRRSERRVGPPSRCSGRGGGPHVIASPDSCELLLRVLAHGLQQPVAGSAADVVGDHERLVDEQRELVEHLVALHARRPPATA